MTFSGETQAETSDSTLNFGRSPNIFSMNLSSLSGDSLCNSASTHMRAVNPKCVHISIPFDRRIVNAHSIPRLTMISVVHYRLYRELTQLRHADRENQSRKRLVLSADDPDSFCVEPVQRKCNDEKAFQCVSLTLLQSYHESDRTLAIDEITVILMRSLNNSQ